MAHVGRITNTDVKATLLQKDLGKVNIPEEVVPLPLFANARRYLLQAPLSFSKSIYLRLNLSTNLFLLLENSLGYIEAAPYLFEGCLEGLLLG